MKTSLEPDPKKQASSTIERREDPRVPVQLTIHYRGLGLRGFGRRGVGLVSNISEGGLLVGVASSRVSRGMKLMAELEHGDIEGSCQLPGVVVRVNKMGFAIRFGAVESDQLGLLRQLLNYAAEKAALDGELLEIPAPARTSPIETEVRNP